MSDPVAEIPASPASGRPPAPPLNDGSRNLNPTDIGFWQLLKEDYRTYDRDLTELGLWAIWTHRFGNWRMGVRPKLLRLPLSLLYKFCYYFITWFWGIKLDYTVQVGRRVRLWHHGGMILGARAIGDDVHLRQNTTLGLADRRDRNAKPTLGNGVEVGTGAVIVGDIVIGEGAIIGANAVVTKDVPPYTVWGGVPARQLKVLQRPEAPAAAASARPAPALNSAKNSETTTPAP